MSTSAIFLTTSLSPASKTSRAANPVKEARSRDIRSMENLLAEKFSERVDAFCKADTTVYSTHTCCSERIPRTRTGWLRHEHTPSSPHACRAGGRRRRLSASCGQRSSSRRSLTQRSEWESERISDPWGSHQSANSSFAFSIRVPSHWCMLTRTGISTSWRSVDLNMVTYSIRKLK